jgi:LysR family glycine cleavage system transcriptional activator
VFEDANILLRGAAEGQGAIVGWLPLIDQDLREGRVVRLFDEDITPTHGYFVTIWNDILVRDETQKVLDWLVSQDSKPEKAVTPEI